MIELCDFPLIIKHYYRAFPRYGDDTENYTN